MNGSATSVLIWIVTGLLGVVSALIGFIVHLHVSNDSENNKDVWDELKMQRKRLHDIIEDISKWKVDTLKDR